MVYSSQLNKWEVVLLRKAYKQLKKLPKSIQDILFKSLKDLEIEGPQPNYWDVKKTGYNEYRLRINYRYRMRYRIISKRLLIEVFYIGRRKDAYK